MDKITRILENVVRCKYFGAGVHIKHPIKNTYQDSLGRTTQTLETIGILMLGSMFVFMCKVHPSMTYSHEIILHSQMWKVVVWWGGNSLTKGST